MRFKISLNVQADDSGTVLPISYQFELASCVYRLLTTNYFRFRQWLESNGLSHSDDRQQKVYSISNLYIPKVQVDGDRLIIGVPRVQFWISFWPREGTADFVRKCFSDQTLLIGDKKTRVKFVVTAIEEMPTIEFTDQMEYLTLAPIVVIGMRPNGSLEYLDPQNPCYSQFAMEDLTERYGRLMRRPYDGPHDFKWELLAPPKRKGVTIYQGTPKERKVVGYMLRFRLTAPPELQEMAYETGLGDKINFGFGYVELLNNITKTRKEEKNSQEKGLIEK